MYKDILSGKIDVFFMLANHKEYFLTYLIEYTKFKYFVSAEDIDINKMKYFIPTITFDYFPLKYYFVNRNESVKSLYINQIILTNVNTDEDMVYNFIKSLYENLGFFKNYIKNFASFYEWKFIPYDNSIDIHPGAKRFYIEKGFLTYGNKSSPILEHKYSIKSHAIL